MDKEKREAILKQIGDQTDYQIVLTDLNIKRLEKELAKIDKNENEAIAKKQMEINAMKQGKLNSETLREVINEEV
jgi:hypothetical protein